MFISILIICYYNHFFFFPYITNLFLPPKFTPLCERLAPVEGTLYCWASKLLYLVIYILYCSCDVFRWYLLENGCINSWIWNGSHTNHWRQVRQLLDVMLWTLMFIWTTSYFAVGGMKNTSTTQQHHTAQVLSFAYCVLQLLDDFNKEHASDGIQLQFRMGVHCGPCVGSVIGTRQVSFDLWVCFGYFHFISFCFCFVRFVFSLITDLLTAILGRCNQCCFTYGIHGWR